MSKQFNCLKHPRVLYVVEEHAYVYAKLGVTVRCDVSSSINGLDETLGGDSLPLSRICSIEDGALIS